MKKPTTPPFIFLASLLFLTCNESISPPQDNSGQYVIQSTVPENQNEICWFNVIDIVNDLEKCVFAVQEIEGSYYLPIYSRLPSFNNKVVDGLFMADSVNGMPARDTLFKVTRIIRDTTAGFPH